MNEEGRREETGEGRREMGDGRKEGAKGGKGERGTVEERLERSKETESEGMCKSCEREYLFIFRLKQLNNIMNVLG